MEIISVSMDSKQLGKLDALAKKLGFRSRSKLIRAAADSLLNEYSALDSRKGHCDAVFTITYSSSKSDTLSNLLSEFEDVVVTEIHQHHQSICLRVLITCGEASRIRQLFSHLKLRKQVNSVQISLL